MTIYTRKIAGKDGKPDVYVTTKSENGQVSVAKIIDGNNDGIDSDDRVIFEGASKTWTKKELEENLFKKYTETGSTTSYEKGKKVELPDVNYTLSGDTLEILSTKESSLGSLAKAIGLGGSDSKDDKEKTSAIDRTRNFIQMLQGGGGGLGFGGGANFFGMQTPMGGAGSFVDPKFFMGDTVSKYQAGAQFLFMQPGAFSKVPLEGFTGNMWQDVYNSIIGKFQKQSETTETKTSETKGGSSSETKSEKTDANGNITLTQAELDKKIQDAKDEAAHNKDAQAQLEIEIRDEATELGIKDADTADIATLKAEIKTKKEANERELKELTKEAKKLEIEVDDDETVESLTEKIKTKKQEMKKEKIQKDSGKLAKNLEDDFSEPFGTSTDFATHIAKIDKSNVSQVLGSYKGLPEGKSLITAISEEYSMFAKAPWFATESLQNKDKSIKKIGDALIERAKELKIDTTEFEEAFGKELKSQTDTEDTWGYLGLVNPRKLETLADELNDEIKEKEAKLGSEKEAAETETKSEAETVKIEPAKAKTKEKAAPAAEEKSWWKFW